MSHLKERSHDFGVDDEGDIVPLEDYSDMPVANESIVQGMHNLEEVRRHERMIREDREDRLAAKALENAGVYVTLEEHRENQRKLVDIASDISMYKGGEKGGYQTKEFNERYKDHSPVVEGGARRRHQKIVHEELPKIYRAAELKAAGFDPVLVDYDAKTTMRSELMSRYGGPQNKRARDKWRKRLS